MCAESWMSWTRGACRQFVDLTYVNIRHTIKSRVESSGLWGPWCKALRVDKRWEMFALKRGWFGVLHVGVLAVEAAKHLRFRVLQGVVFGLTPRSRIVRALPRPFANRSRFRRVQGQSPWIRFAAARARGGWGRQARSGRLLELLQGAVGLS